MNRTPNWWKTHFDRDTLSGYALDRKTPAEVRGVIRLLDLKPRAKVLDLCCGAGRHALLLAEHGFDVTGIDLMADLLAHARNEAAARDIPLTLLKSDCRRLPFRGKFDAAVNLFTSFGYFEREADDARALAAVYRALKPGGRLVMDLLNKEWLMRYFKPRFSSKVRTGSVAETISRLSFDFETGRLNTRRTLIFRGGRRRQTFLSIRVYALTEMRRLLDAAGMRLETVYGGLDGRAYGMDSFRMVLVARKPRA